MAPKGRAKASAGGMELGNAPKEVAVAAAWVENKDVAENPKPLVSHLPTPLPTMKITATQPTSKRRGTPAKAEQSTLGPSSPATSGGKRRGRAADSPQLQRRYSLPEYRNQTTSQAVPGGFSSDDAKS